MPDDERKYDNLAFVLLSEPRLCSGEEIQQAFGSFAARGEKLLLDGGSNQPSGDQQVISFGLKTGETVFVSLMPVPVPKGEADDGAQFSLSSFRDGWRLPPHHAHLIVWISGPHPGPAVVPLSRFTSVLAAVTKAAPAVGVYWGNAGATHDAEFFVSIASDQGITPRITLWTGVSVGRETDGRLSLLSLGMKQLSLPDLLLVADETSANSALATMFDLLAYVAERGEAIQEGGTIGRTADEKLPVRYVPSPVDPGKKVWKVEMQ